MLDKLVGSCKNYCVLIALFRFRQTNSTTKNKEDYKHMHITKVIKNTDYVPIRTASRKDDKMIIETM